MWTPTTRRHHSRRAARYASDLTMASAVQLRLDFDGAALRRLARSSRDAKQVRRLLALAAIYEGESRSEAARIGGVTLQIVRD